MDRPNPTDTDTHLATALTRVGNAVPRAHIREAERRGPAFLPALRATATDAHAILAQDPEGDTTLLWAAIAAGVIGGPDAAALLSELMQAEPEVHSALRNVAAEALARCGDAALPHLMDLSRSGEEADRHWAYVALGWVGTPPARSRLLEALDEDSDLLDVTALALAGSGASPAETTPALLAALARAAPWQRPEIEDALQTLHGADRAENPLATDWRVRYGFYPAYWPVPPGWPLIAALVRHDQQLRKTRSTLPVRTLEEILAEAELPPRRCEDCGEELVRYTGFLACPDSAALLASIQVHYIDTLLADSATGLWRAVETIDDVLDDLDERGLDLGTRPEPRTRQAQTDRDDFATTLAVTRGACRWLLDQGIEDVEAGLDRLREEASALETRFGRPAAPPRNLLRILTGREPPASAPPKVGRNDPCPCGSGRKFKKCCGKTG
jgi:hypothetical protein